MRSTSSRSSLDDDFAEQLVLALCHQLLAELELEVAFGTYDIALALSHCEFVVAWIDTKNRFALKESTTGHHFRAYFDHPTDHLGSELDLARRQRRRPSRGRSLVPDRSESLDIRPTGRRAGRMALGLGAHQNECRGNHGAGNDDGDRQADRPRPRSVVPTVAT